ncbi:helix-turn-helix domain-containing protein [Archangium sp.]|uniref:helix-turn-helix domain-containing protein n=1 Tax=Archangium sp. TaxID=1872627 RepID=UPI0039C88A3E
MPRPYSTDLRERVLAACDRGCTIEEVAEQFGLAVATVKRWRRLQHRTGSAGPVPHGGGRPPRVVDKGLTVVSQIVQEHADLTVAEIAAEYRTRTGIAVSRSSMGRTLQRLALTRKKSP